MKADVIVVGAGPAGSSAALRLARAGLDVALIERARFPRTKVCGEYLSPALCGALAELGLLAEVARNAHPLRAIQLAGFGSDPVLLRLPGDGALALPRARLDQIMLDAAHAAGAHVIAGAFLSSAETADRVAVRYRDADGADRAAEARVLVGADGAWSSVARRMDMSGPVAREGRWAVGGHLSGQADGEVLEMYVGPGGYYARNPLGAGRANSMLVLPDARRGDAAEQAVSEITGGRRRFDAAAIEKMVAVGPLRYRPRTVARGRVLLSGDAAGLLDPFVGQGMAIAVESSRAVEEAAHRLLSGRAPERARRRFAAARRAAVLPRTLLAAAIEVIIRNRFLRSRADRAVHRSPVHAEAVLAAVAGAVPARTALTPAAIGRLIA